jgi:hypothetical protein
LLLCAAYDKQNSAAFYKLVHQFNISTARSIIMWQ